MVNSCDAEHPAVGLSRLLQSKVSVLHVSEYHPRVRARELVKWEEKIGANILSRTNKIFEKAGVPVEVLEVEFGHPADIICRMVDGRIRPNRDGGKG